MNYSEIVSADMRLVILRGLAEDADYSHNEHVLKSMLGYVGHKVSTDRLRTELAWLAEQGLVVVEDVAGVAVAKLTRRGNDTARGNVIVPGVKRPEPEL